MNKCELIESIVSETYIILSAIEAKDIDIVESSLENRRKLIESFNLAEESIITECTKEKIGKFKFLNTKCIKQLKQMRSELESEMSNVKGEKNKAVKTQKIHDSYMNQNYNIKGNWFDLKK